jgi:site-specific recombinase XerC
MGRKRKQDYAEFMDWLEDNRGVSPATASNYASRVRRMMHAMETVTEPLHQTITTEGLDALLLTDPFNRYPANYTAAWRALVEFAKSKGIEVPSPSPSVTSKQYQYAIPDSIADDLLYIVETCDLTRGNLASLKWCHVDGEPKHGKLWVQVPGSHGDFVQAHAPAVERIRQWAHPDGPKAEDPWIPEEPGSRTAMPERVVRRLLARRKRTRRR